MGILDSDPLKHMVGAVRSLSVAKNWLKRVGIQPIIVIVKKRKRF